MAKPKPRKRDYRAEYARRKANKQPTKKRGSQRKPVKRTKKRRVVIRPTVIDDNLELGLKLVRRGKSLHASAKLIGASPGRLRRYGTKTGALRKRGLRWVARSDRRHRVMPIYSRGKSLTITVTGYISAARVGRYLAAVRQFLQTNDRDQLAPFVGESVRDANRKSHPFETRPNVLYRLDSAHAEPFEQIYRIVA